MNFDVFKDLFFALYIINEQFPALFIYRTGLLSISMMNISPVRLSFGISVL